MLSPESIVSPEAQLYLGVNPAVISLLQDGTRELVWGLVGNGNKEQYHTLRWFSDAEKKAIEEKIQVGDMIKIQEFLNRYI